jgi:hypothetical protein
MPFDAPEETALGEFKEASGKCFLRSRGERGKMVDVCDPEIVNVMEKFNVVCGELESFYCWH